MTECLSPAVLTHSATRPLGVLARVKQGAASVWKNFRDRRATHELLAMDDRLLHDIGLARGDVYEALDAREEGTALLGARAARRRSEAIERLRAGLRSTLPLAPGAVESRFDRAA